MGLERRGFSPEANPPLRWSETDNVKWKVQIPGEGSATPIVWNDRIFVLTAIPTGKKAEASNDASAQGGRGGGGQKPTEFYQFAILCIDRNTGKTLWQKVASEVVPHEGHQQDNPYGDKNLLVVFQKPM